MLMNETSEPLQGVKEGTSSEFFNMGKAKEFSHVPRSRKGQPELGKNIQGKPSID